MKLSIPPEQLVGALAGQEDLHATLPSPLGELRDRDRARVRDRNAVMNGCGNERASPTGRRHLDQLELDAERISDSPSGEPFVQPSIPRKARAESDEIRHLLRRQSGDQARIDAT